MRTGAVDKPIAALLVTKEDQVLTEKPDRLDRAVRRQLFNQRGRLPVQTHQLAGRRFRSGAGNQLVTLCAHHDEMPRQGCAMHSPSLAQPIGVEFIKPDARLTNLLPDSQRLLQSFGITSLASNSRCS